MLTFKVMLPNTYGIKDYEDYEEYGIKFWYTGKTKGSPPKITNVALVKLSGKAPFISANYGDDHESPILYSAKAVLVEEYAVLINEYEHGLKYHQKEIKRVIRLENPTGFIVAILKGDNFCYKTGRTKAFIKLLKMIDNADIRFMASQTYFDWESSLEQTRKLNAAAKMLTNAGYSVGEPNMEEPF
jgi:hypothetical protein